LHDGRHPVDPAKRNQDYQQADETDQPGDGAPRRTAGSRELQRSGSVSSPGSVESSGNWGLVMHINAAVGKRDLSNALELVSAGGLPCLGQ
jgi:hypothetical protein